MPSNRQYTQLLVDYYTLHPEMFDKIDLERRAYLTDDAYDAISKNMEKVYGTKYVVDRVNKGTMGGKYAQSLKNTADTNKMVTNIHKATNKAAKVTAAIGGGIGGLMAAPALATAYTSYVPAAVKSGVEGYLAYDSAKNLASDNGIKKTVREFLNGNTGAGIKSAIGDVLDLTGAFGGGVAALKHASNIPNEYRRAMELLVRYKGNTKNGIQTPISMMEGMLSNPDGNLRAIVEGSEEARREALLNARSIRWEGNKPKLLDPGVHYSEKSKKFGNLYLDFISKFDGSKDTLYYKYHPKEFNALGDGAVIDDSWRVVDLKAHPEFNAPEMLSIFNAKGIKNPTKVLVPVSTNVENQMKEYRNFFGMPDKKMIGSHENIHAGKFTHDTDGVDSILGYTSLGTPKKMSVDVLDYSDNIREGYKQGFIKGTRNLLLHALDLGAAKPVRLSNVGDPSLVKLEEFMQKVPDSRLVKKFNLKLNAALVAPGSRRDAFNRAMVFNPNYKVNEGMNDVFGVLLEKHNPFFGKKVLKIVQNKYLKDRYSRDLAFGGTSQEAIEEYNSKANNLYNMFENWRRTEYPYLVPKKPRS